MQMYFYICIHVHIYSKLSKNCWYQGRNKNVYGEHQSNFSKWRRNVIQNSLKRCKLGGLSCVTLCFLYKTPVETEMQFKQVCPVKLWQNFRYTTSFSDFICPLEGSSTITIDNIDNFIVSIICDSSSVVENQATLSEWHNHSWLKTGYSSVWSSIKSHINAV